MTQIVNGDTLVDVTTSGQVVAQVGNSSLANTLLITAGSGLIFNGGHNASQNFSVHGTTGEILGVTANKVQIKSDINTLDSIAIGNGAAANVGNLAYAIGTNARANGGNAIAIGWNTLAGDNINSGCVAIGQSAQAPLANTTALGPQVVAAGANNVVIGVRSQTAGLQSIGIGAEAYALTDYAVAIGAFATATARNAMAIGEHSSAGFQNSVALGKGVSTTATNQLKIGNATTQLNTAISGTLTASASPASGTIIEAAGTGTILFPRAVSTAVFPLTTTSGSMFYATDVNKFYKCEKDAWSPLGSIVAGDIVAAPLGPVANAQVRIVGGQFTIKYNSSTDLIELAGANLLGGIANNSSIVPSPDDTISIVLPVTPYYASASIQQLNGKLNQYLNTCYVGNVLKLRLSQIDTFGRWQASSWKFVDYVDVLRQLNILVIGTL